MADQRIEPILAESARPTAVAIPAPVAVSVPEARRLGRLGQLLEREHVLAGVLLAPTLTILALFIAYPFLLGIWLAVSDKVVGRPGSFVGLENFRVNLNDSIFLRAFQNTFVYTFIATILKLALGMAAALLLNHHFRFKRIVRASMLLPWIVPTVLSTLAWQWMFDSTFSVFNWMLMNAGLISKRILWLGDGTSGPTRQRAQGRRPRSVSRFPPGSARCVGQPWRSRATTRRPSSAPLRPTSPRPRASCP